MRDGSAPTSRPTLDQVARAAGVGRGTASRVLNDSPHVSSQARARVLRAVADLGYVPNQAARSLVTRRTDTVALVVSEPEERVFGEPYFAAIVRGIGQRLGEAGLQMLLAMPSGDSERTRAAAYLADRHVDGVLLLSLHAEDPLPALLEERDVPTVTGGRPSAVRPRCVVDVDNLAGGRTAVQHLVGTGRRRLAVLAGPQDMSSGRDRLVGALDAADDAGIPPDGVSVAYGDYSEESGRRAMTELLGAGPAPGAVFAASDLMAVGALRALRSAGLSVPDDVSLVGYDDAPVARLTDPELTTVHQPVTRMGQVMVDLLVDRLSGVEVPRETVLQTRLVVRGSA
ncbi:LacI family DNA-binding transcriptional regulator [Phycicoccus sp. CSK15P-2]|uniref:LacI family DNA-binding transcriptional regulator n=1 Tax=Phycicoccus sp. CSK15P-2 TaxID=2807627 RepID=UPI0019517B24|nr:LacI family DNA-binding transcriptional regulator [Phycicoccus sp. CSK15P-2]MBM6405344.1 LacI family DNA-binding transcriptional regulator [Phycicoccus sp. CSK15P-2]